MNNSDISFRLYGSVKHQGLAIAGATVTVVPAVKGVGTVLTDPNLTQKTGPRGDFSFTLMAGVYALDVVPDSGTRYVRQCIEEISVFRNTPYPVTLQTGYFLSGVLHVEPGFDLTGCLITLESVVKSGYQITARPDPDGSFAFTIPRGKYNLVAYSEVFDEDVSGALQALRIVTVSDVIEINRDMSHDLNFPRLHRLTGIVKDGSGAPVTRAKVTITRYQGDNEPPLTSIYSGAALRVDSEGTFAIDLQPGKYDVQIQPPVSAAKLSGTLHCITIDADVQQEFALSQGFQVQGIVGFHGEAVPGCRVTVNAQNSGLQTAVVTDEQGQFALRLPAGEYEMRLPAQRDPLQKGSDQTCAPWCQSFSVSADSDVIVELQDGHHVTFHVVNENDDSISGSRIVWGPYGKEEQTLASAGEAYDGSRGSALTDDQGICNIILPAGVYFFQIVAPENSAWQIKNIRQLSINASVARKIRLSHLEEVEDEKDQQAAVQLSITQGLGR